MNNLTSQVDSLNGNALTTGLFKPGNRDSLWGTTTYTYDSDGNRLSAGSTSYTWSAIGQLLKVTSGSSAVEYGYNALGDLVQRKTNGRVDRYFIWDMGQLLLLLDSLGNRIAEYAYLPNGEPLSYMTGGATYYYNTDLRGDVVGVNDGVNVNQQINYGPWGNVENLNGWSLDSTRLGWKGNMWEGGITQLYYVHNRWYDPASRGFLSEDPTGLAGGLNTYAYTANDPVNGNDPLGLNDATGECQYAFWGDMFMGADFTGCGGGADVIDLLALLETIGPAVQIPDGGQDIDGPPRGLGGGGRTPGLWNKAWNIIKSDCAQGIGSLMVTVAGDATFYMGGTEVAEATKAAWQATREAAAIGSKTYHARVLGRYLMSSALANQTNAALGASALTLEWAKGVQQNVNSPDGARAQAEGEFWPGWTDWIPFVDLVNAVTGAVASCRGS